MSMRIHILKTVTYLSNVKTYAKEILQDPFYVIHKIKEYWLIYYYTFTFLYNYVNQEFHLLISDHSKIQRAPIF